MPRTEDAAAGSDSSNAAPCGNCSKVLHKPLVCARCTTATQGLPSAHTTQEKGEALQKRLSSTSQTHTTNTNVTE